MYKYCYYSQAVTFLFGKEYSRPIVSGGRARTYAPDESARIVHYTPLKSAIIVIVNIIAL